MNTNFVAQILGQTPTSLELGGWLVCAVAVAMGANQVLKLFDRFKETPPPRDTYQVKGDYATRGEVLRLEEKIDGLGNEIRAEMKTDRETLGKAAEERTRILVADSRQVLEAVSELRGVVNRMREETKVWFKNQS